MKIGDRQIGKGPGVYIIAELGVNHDGLVDRALELTRAAKEAGADAIKLQYFETDRLMSKSAKLAAYQRAAGETDPIAMLRRLELSIDQMEPIVRTAHEMGLHAIVTVFSTELVDAAERLAWDAYKTASPDIMHKPLLERLARTAKPIVVSTGAATIDEVRMATGWLTEWGAAGRLALLQCVSCYPTPVERAEFGGIAALKAKFDGPAGYSDHTSTIETGAEAVACGATILEKHLTYSKKTAGPDHAASLEPGEFVRYCELARAAALHGRASRPCYPADGMKRVLDIEEDVRRVSRQSAIAVCALRPGDTISQRDITIKRPGTGVPPREASLLIGKRVVRPIVADTVIVWEDVR